MLVKLIVLFTLMSTPLILSPHTRQGSFRGSGVSMVILDNLLGLVNLDL